jgi:hypothetical protein
MVKILAPAFLFAAATSSMAIEKRQNEGDSWEQLFHSDANGAYECYC